ncbi:cellulose biosynthesis protein BcsG [Photobacterium alginatilyticum]|uniref:Cellulose biosynthesis protein BcsG n=1 Tax=Photobacterium alginatilyticum TaxID=1775171 RepID=A0ABW9YH94_9GAMM|nr:cellulose biosynthesis protein BcsG [Photobacterium alginatilyticum]NBI53075.1 cellulose biosynthesis protein BcsG [Photobacterium alginatilyticum]
MTTKQLSEKVTWSLGWWNIYFLLKIALKVKGVIGFSTLYNFAFFFFLLIPVANKGLRAAKNSIAVVVGLWLFHYDSFLPPLDRLTTQLSQLLQFDSLYLLELLTRFISLDIILLLCLILIGYYFAQQVFRVTSLVMITMVFFSFSNTEKPLYVQAKVPTTHVSQNDIHQTRITPPQTASALSAEPPGAELKLPDIIDDISLNQYRKAFFANEAQKRSSLQSGLNLNHNFDVLLLNICSISWDDLDLTGQTTHPLWAEFDILFENFNSATAYSGPAVIRLLRASCGQQEHTSLFEAASNKQCLLFENLAQLGFKNELLLNHNGEFGNFMTHISNNIGALSPAVDLDKLSPYQKSFDGSSIYRDATVLKQWLAQTNQTRNTPTVTLYNSISAHDGNRIIRGNSGSSLISYRQQQKNVLDDLYAFVNKLKKSDRNLVVIFVPEHGAAMRGDKMQIQGMREVPTKTITHVPVGIKFFGPDLNIQGDKIQLNQPNSYLAISDLLGNIIASDVFSGKPFQLSDLVQNLDEVGIVSQNQGTTILEIRKSSFLTLDDESWLHYDAK